MRIFLASASSRRRLWLEAQSWMEPHSISIVPLNLDEAKVFDVSDVSGTVRNVVGLKIESARALLNGDGGDWIGIVSDTMVEDPVRKMALGKPRDSKQAREMLSTLSGRNHKVWTCTGILLPRNKGDMIYTESADVYFRNLDVNALDDLIESGSWAGKAGGYDIHGRASDFVEVVKGSEITVLGLSENSIIALREILEK
ncbi:MAG: hypothetical protein CMA31_03820 [Euryarchaeota archaeon]|nr:hypothetical protein [Euryarchaeota archaeon]RPG71318.1 MAG: hypothetical protein CBD52_005115 [Euryarchaeota archaeon TMED192]